MAEFRPMDDEQRQAWDAWVASRPSTVQAVARRLRPNVLYRLKSSGHRVTLYSISEDGTVTVFVSGRFNCVTFDCRVFGINPDDLEECDLPGPDEPTGTLFTRSEEIDAFIAARAQDIRAGKPERSH